MGGGVVAEFFRDLRKPTRFSGEGVVAEFFRGLHTFSVNGPFYIFRGAQRRGARAPPGSATGIVPLLVPCHSG